MLLPCGARCPCHAGPWHSALLCQTPIMVYCNHLSKINFFMFPQLDCEMMKVLLPVVNELCLASSTCSNWDKHTCFSRLKCLPFPPVHDQDLLEEPALLPCSSSEPNSFYGFSSLTLLLTCRGIPSWLCTSGGTHVWHSALRLFLSRKLVKQGFQN